MSDWLLGSGKWGSGEVGKWGSFWWGGGGTADASQRRRYAGIAGRLRPGMRDGHGTEGDPFFGVTGGGGFRRRGASNESIPYLRK